MKERKKFNLFDWIVIIVLIIIIPLLILFGAIIIKSKKNPGEIPDIFGYKPMIVMSGSMETELYTGDLAFVKVVDVTTLKKGDIIAFRDEDNKVTTHRIVDIILNNENLGFVTKGDSNDIVDASLVNSSSVEGVYQFKVSKLGTVLMWLQKPTGLTITLLIIVFIGGISIFIQNQNELNRLKKQIKS